MRELILPEVQYRLTLYNDANLAMLPVYDMVGIVGDGFISAEDYNNACRTLLRSTGEEQGARDLLWSLIGLDMNDAESGAKIGREVYGAPSDEGD